MYRRNITGFSHQILSIFSFSFFFWISRTATVMGPYQLYCKLYPFIYTYIYIYYVRVCLGYHDFTRVSYCCHSVKCFWAISVPRAWSSPRGKKRSEPNVLPPLQLMAKLEEQLPAAQKAVSKQFVWSLQPMFYVFVFFLNGISCTWYVWYLLLRAVVFVGATLSPTFPWSPGPTVKIGPSRLDLFSFLTSQGFLRNIPGRFRELPWDLVLVWPMIIIAKSADLQSFFHLEAIVKH